jgi:hypothetical protein
MDSLFPIHNLSTPFLPNLTFVMYCYDTKDIVTVAELRVFNIVGHRLKADLGFTKEEFDKVLLLRGNNLNLYLIAYTSKDQQIAAAYRGFLTDILRSTTSNSVEVTAKFVGDQVGTGMLDELANLGKGERLLNDTWEECKIQLLVSLTEEGKKMLGLALWEEERLDEQRNTPHWFRGY